MRSRITGRKQKGEERWQEEEEAVWGSLPGGELPGRGTMSLQQWKESRGCPLSAALVVGEPSKTGQASWALNTPEDGHGKMDPSRKCHSRSMRDVLSMASAISLFY